MPVPLGSSGQWPVKDFPGWMDRTERWLRGLDARIANVGRIAGGGGGGGTDPDAPVNGQVTLWTSTSTASVANNTDTVVTGWVTQAAPYGLFYSVGPGQPGPGGLGSPGAIQFTVPGFYLSVAQITWAAGVTNTRRIVRFLGGPYGAMAEIGRTDWASNANMMSQQVTAMFAANVGDQLQVVAWHSNGSALALSSGTPHRWMLTRLGDLPA